MCAHIGGGAHFDAGDDAHGEERRQDGAAAVAQKRQGQTDDRKQAEADADVDEDLEQQHRGDADADEAVHIIRGLHADLNAAQDDGQQQEQGGKAAEHAKLLANGREDGVCVLGGQVADARQVAVEQTLPRQPAVAQGLKAFVRLPQHAEAVRVYGRVDQGKNALLLVVADKVFPEIGRDGRDGARAAEEPPAAHAADIGHDNEQEHEDQRNAGIVRNDDDQGDDPEHVERERADGAQRGDAVAVQAHGLGQNDDIGDLADLGGLNIERQEGKVQPAFVAGRTLDAPDEQHGQKGGIEQAHTMLRMVLPKKTSFEFLTQWDVNLIASHINSTPRESLNGHPRIPLQKKHSMKRS